MTSNLARYRDDINKLTALGTSMLSDLTFRHLRNTRKLGDSETVEAAKVAGLFDREYQKWYTEAHAVIKQLIPDRLMEFEHLYKGDGKRRQIAAANYSIQDWLNGIGAPNDPYGNKIYDDFAAVVMRFQTQVQILSAITQRFESALFDIRQLLSIAQRANKRVTALMANFAIVIAAAIIETCIAMSFGHENPPAFSVKFREQNGNIMVAI